MDTRTSSPSARGTDWNHRERGDDESAPETASRATESPETTRGLLVAERPKVPKARRMRRFAWIRRLIRKLGPDEVAVYEEEEDIHLNPKIGPDWMLSGQQKEV